MRTSKAAAPMAEHALPSPAIEAGAPRQREDRARADREDRAGPEVEHQFHSAAQQRDSDRLGMWIFLATEILFFGVLFAAYTFLRLRFPEAWAEASRLTDVTLGTINTAVLLTSSLTMALAVEAVRKGPDSATPRSSARDRPAVLWLAATLVLGLAFVGLKGLEYAHDFRQHLVPLVDFAAGGTHRAAVELFFCFYFGMTAIHALHLLIGIGIVGTLLVLAWRGRARAAPVELSGLYWHLVDVVWIFLYPLLYLVSRT